MAKLIGIEIKQTSKSYTLTDSLGNSAETTNPTTVFDFLLKGWDNKHTFKVFWNLYEFVDLLKSLLPEKEYETLIKNDKVETIINGRTYRFFSSPGRMFSLTAKISTHYASNPEINLYHLSQFFPNDTVESAADIATKGKELLTALDEMGFNPTKLSSSVAIYDEKLKALNPPTIFDLKDEGTDFCDFAYHLMNREWRTVYKVGHWENAYDLDLRSGYPSVVKDFHNTSKCKFWKASTLQKSDFGILKGTIDITSDFSPIVNAYGENRKGKYGDYFTTGQIGFLYHYGLGTFNIQEGRYLKYLTDEKPFEKTMHELYTLRSLGGIKKDFAKSVSVGIGGRFSQEHKEKFGSFYNPIYSVMMTSGTSLKVGKFIMENDLAPYVISVMVDGFLSEKSATVNDTGLMGDWRIEKVKALVLSIGNQYVLSESGTNKKDAHLNNYSTMIEAIKTHPNKSVYNNVIIAKDLAETKRIFKDYPKTGKDILNHPYTSTAIISD